MRNHGCRQELGPAQTYESVLDEISAGYSGDELGPWSFLPTDPNRLRRIRRGARRGETYTTNVIVIETDKEACVPGSSWGDAPVAEVSGMPAVRAGTQRW